MKITPQECSAFLSSVQIVGLDDFQLASVSTVYQVFEAFQSPGKREQIVYKLDIHIMVITTLNLEK